MSTYDIVDISTKFNKNIKQLINIVDSIVPNNIIIETIKNSDFSIGYDAAAGELCDMYETGIIDPAKVTRSGLQNASSIAGMILTTECIVVDSVKKE